MFGWRDKRNRELDEELQAHLALAARDQNLSQARRQLGNITLIKEVTRQMWSWHSLETFAQDIRYGLRVMRRSPGFTAVALLSLALGIGVNTAIFSLVNAVILKALPVHNPAQLVIVGDTIRIGSLSQGSGIQAAIYSYPFFQRFRERNTVFSDVYATGRSEHLTIALADGAKSIPQTGKVTARFVSGNYFSLLGVRPSLGRAFTASETRIPGASPVVVISYGYWQRQFGGNPAILNRKLLINDAPFTIIGIAPRSFAGDIVGAPIDIWFPLTMKAEANPGYDYFNDPMAHWLLLMGRLKPGVTLGHATAEINVLGKQIYTELYSGNTSPDDFRQLERAQFPVSSGMRGFSRIRQNFSGPLLLLMCAVALVLLICCANVANLQLARAAARTREMSLRLAIGAGRGRLIRQLLTESLLLAIGGGALGLLVSVWTAKLLLGFAAQSERLPLDLHLDSGVLLFTAAIALFAGVLFGLAPAAQSARANLAGRLRETRAGQSSAFSGTLVAVQVALSMILLVGAGLFVRTLQNLKNSDVGYMRNQLVLARLDFKAAGYSGPAILNLANRLIATLSATPGVQAVTVSENGLFSGTDSQSDDAIEGYVPHSYDDRENHSDRVGPNYFQIVGTPILAGRGITAQDNERSSPVAVINESMARFYFPRTNPLGRHITDPDRKTISYTIVGVVSDVKQSDLREAAPRRFYMSYFQPKESDRIAAMNLELRTTGNASTVLNSIRRQIASVDPKLPLVNLSSASELIDQTLGQEQLVAKLCSLFGLLSLVLAAIGLYGVVSYRTARRTSEIGIRMALGAGRARVIRMVLGETGVLVGAGIAAGIVAATVSSAFVRSMLFGLSSFEVGPTLAAAAVIAIASLIATLLPAWRAARVDPTVALRVD